MDKSAGPGSIDEYIAGFPPETRERLERIRSIARKAAPDAVETISYSMPTFDLSGRHVVHFAAFARHIGVYPTPTGMDEFKEELSGFRTGKGSAQFPLDEPLPVDLIRRIVEFRVAAVRAKGPKGRR